ncbi:VanZ family protein [Streptomyces sp. A1-5]|uniref:VanZ family protein n=1 Tax=Streptomyces sp. A1-5 TaxID=2738410 RepID=UPI001F3BACA3|nr:VanZ family protein [Streptomyces sp. A1-5]UJB45607.1 VanZ family protein [Streptomyces sp. A1-5]
MIEASIRALPGLIPVFLVLAAVLGLAAAAVAKAKGGSVVLSLLCAGALAGVLVVTLLPGGGGTGQGAFCDTGLPGWAFLGSESSRLNVALFVPISFLAVLLFRRPIVVLSGSLLLTGGIELVQAVGELGRACSYDDLKANALGGCLGVLFGVVALWVRQRRWPLTRRDTLWGAGSAALGGLLLTGAFAAAVEPVHGDAQAQARRALEFAQESWLDGAIADLYGRPEDGMTVIRKKVAEGRWRLEVDLGRRGSLVVRWPERRLERFRWEEPDGDRDGAAGAGDGVRAAGRARSAGDRFVGKWFPEVRAGAEVTVVPLRDGRGGHVLSYRDPASGAGDRRGWRRGCRLAAGWWR